MICASYSNGDGHGVSNGNGNGHSDSNSNNNNNRYIFDLTASKVKTDAGKHIADVKPIICSQHSK